MTPGKDCDDGGAAAASTTTATPSPGREGLLARVVRVSWPHLALLVVYFIYLALGGWVFLTIEGGSGQEQADLDAQLAEYKTLKDRLDEAVRNLTEGREVVLEGNLTATWEKYTYLVEDAYLIPLQFARRTDWTFTGSVLFCATTIATIGYGDAVPVTDLGRVLIVIYSLVGIPLTLTFLADIGGLLARLVIVISRACSCRRKKSGSYPRSVRNNTQHVASSGEPGAHHLQNGGTTGPEERESEDDIRDVRLTLGIFRDSSAEPVCSSQRSSRRNSTVDDSEIALRAAQAVNAPSGTDAFGGGTGLWTGETNLGFLPEATVVPDEEKKSPNGHGACGGERTDDRTDGNEEDTDRVTGHVPVAIVVVILLVYTFLGALMIAYVEEWYYGEALYFTFVTLTTIGFGDFVPVKHYMDIPSFFGCLIYTIVGLSVMSMCIALVQAKVVKLMSKVAGKVGF